MEIKENDTLLFIGDSITDANRNRDAILGGWSSWGDGYVHLIQSYLTAFHPTKRLMVINQGISGNRIIDLSNRWEEDVLALQPNWVTIMIGVNDVWRHFDDALFRRDEQVTQELFHQHYRQIIEQTMASKSIKGIVLLSAFMVEANQDDPMNKMLHSYNQLTKKLAEQYGLTYIDIQAEINKFLQTTPSYVLSFDRVHPSMAGHMLIAKAWLEGMHFMKGR